MAGRVSIEKALEGLQSDKEKIRDKSFNTLYKISEKTPEKLYPHWDFFVKLLGKGRILIEYYAIHLLPNLVKVDKKDKFKKIFNKFYNLLSHESPVLCIHVAGNSGKIINAKPELQVRIINRLLFTDKTSKCKHKELLKSYVVKAFDECFPNIKNKKKIIRFVQQQLDGKSPKLRKEAKKFIKKWA